MYIGLRELPRRRPGGLSGRDAVPEAAGAPHDARRGGATKTVQPNLLIVIVVITIVIIRLS